SVGGRTCSRRRTAARGRSAPRWSSSRRSTRSSARCAGSSRLTASRSCSARPTRGTLLEELLRTNRAVYRRDMQHAEYPEEEEFLALGLRSRLATPLLQGARTIGMLSLVRREADAFTPEEVELAGLLGRLVASAVQNIRAYEAERRTVEELRRLSALRADFVSLVSHELR